MINVCESLISTFRRRSKSVRSINGVVPSYTLKKNKRMIFRGLQRYLCEFCSPNDFSIFINKIYIIHIDALNKINFKLLTRSSTYFTHKIKELTKEWNWSWTGHSHSTKYIVGTKIVTRIQFISNKK